MSGGSQSGGGGQGGGGTPGGAGGSSTASSSSVNATTISTQVAAANASGGGSSSAYIAIQPNAGIAPDNSGRQMTQYGALINSAGTGFPTLSEAQNALLNAGSAAGYSNFSWSSNNGAGTCALLVW